MKRNSLKGRDLFWSTSVSWLCYYPWNDKREWCMCFLCVCPQSWRPEYNITLRNVAHNILVPPWTVARLCVSSLKMQACPFHGNHRILVTCCGVISNKKFQNKGVERSHVLLGTTNIFSETTAFLCINEVKLLIQTFLKTLIKCKRVWYTLTVLHLQHDPFLWRYKLANTFRKFVTPLRKWRCKIHGLPSKYTHSIKCRNKIRTSTS